MNQNELNELSALVDRRMTVRTLLKEWESGSAEKPLDSKQREAIRHLLKEKAEDCLRLEDAVRRLTEQIEKLETRLGAEPLDAASSARVKRLRQNAKDVGQSLKRLRGTFHPATLGEMHTAALVDPYGDDSAPVAQRVRVPEGDL